MAGQAAAKTVGQMSEWPMCRREGAVKLGMWRLEAAIIAPLAGARMVVV